MDDGNSWGKKEKSVCYRIFKMLYFMTPEKVTRLLGLTKMVSLKGPQIVQSLNPGVIVSKV